MSVRFLMVCFLAMVLCFSCLTGCAEVPSSTPEGPSVPESTSAVTESVESLPVSTPWELKPVEQIGALPGSLQAVVEKNLFHEAVASHGRILKQSTLEVWEEQRRIRYAVLMMDKYGNELAVYEIETDDAYDVTTLTATSDGGFLFALAFQDRAYSQAQRASDNGFASRVIKCDKDGNLLFDTAFNQIEGSALRFCFEKNGQFYLFGTRQTPETKKQGVHSRTDIYMAILDQTGAVLNTACIAGSDFDSLDHAEITEDGFLLSISAQSMDGDFVGSTSIYPIDWVFTVDDALKITDKKMATGRDYFDKVIGERDGQPIHISDACLEGFDGGTPTAYIDYDDFYLIVSNNATAVYEKTPPAISSLWCYWETVYTGYDKDGNLIFRTAVDSSPDYDAIMEALRS